MPNKHRATRGATGDTSATSPRRCVVIGASARAFTESAARRGWQVHAADLFRDADLVAAAVEAVRLGTSGNASLAYPDDLPRAVASFPPGPFVYTGGLENHPRVVAAIARDRPLAGCGPAALAGVRDPERLAAAVRGCGLRFPETRRDAAGVPADGSYLAKPLRSAGGHGISRWRGVAAGESPPRDVVWQRFVDGDGWSASCLSHDGRVRLVGASRPLAAAWCGGGDHAYRGSVDVPLDLVPGRLRAAFETVAAALASCFGLVGLFGLDAVVDAAATVHLLEVNPRPTASMELVERSTGWSVAAGHLAAFGWGNDPPPAAVSRSIWAKAVAYAPGTWAGAAALDAIDAMRERWTATDGLPSVADLPAADAPPAAGRPLVTVFARGDTAATAVATLRHRVVWLRRIVAGPPVSRPAGAPAAGRPPPGRTA